MQIQISTTENCTSPLLVNGFSLEGVPTPPPTPTDPPDNTGGGGGNTGSLGPSDEDEPAQESQ